MRGVHGIVGLFWAIVIVVMGGCDGGGTTSIVEDQGTESSPSSTYRCELTPEPRDALEPNTANPYYDQQWYYHYDKAFYDHVASRYRLQPDPDAHIHPPSVRRYTGKGIKVAIIDDALDLGHEDLKGAIVATYDVASGTENVCPSSDEQNHGTEVTGIIAAGSNRTGIAGIAPEVSVYFIRLPFNTDISDSQIIEAFEKAAEWGVDVVNCSWGSGDVSRKVEEAIVDLARNGRNGKGTIIVFASGNGGYDRIGDLMGNDESAIPEVIGVGSTNIENRRAEYSDYGPDLDLMAPGGEYLGITTLDQMGSAGLATENPDYLLYNDSYAFAGTSASAPIVTAVVARMLQANPALTREEVLQKLEENAEKFDPAGCGYDADGFSEKCGYGKVNLEQTIGAVK